jgi:hypothetical protein
MLVLILVKGDLGFYSLESQNRIIFIGSHCRERLRGMINKQMITKITNIDTIRGGCSCLRNTNNTNIHETMFRRYVKLPTNMTMFAYIIICKVTN